MVATRGKAARQAIMLTAVTPDALAPRHHPIRKIKPMVDQALAQLSPTFDRMYAANGRASIPPERLLMAPFSVRSERQFCERLEYNLRFKWFPDLNIMDHSASGPGNGSRKSSAGCRRWAAAGNCATAAWPAIGSGAIGSGWRWPLRATTW